MDTDNDAACARLTAVAAGYLTDRFAGQLSGQTAAGPRPKLPITNRGTYVRTTAIDRLINRFVAAAAPGQTVQIVSLGAGSDSRYFRMVADRADIPIVYHELDFAANTATKIARLRSGNGPALDVLQRHLRTAGPVSATTVKPDDIRWSSTALHSARYHLHPIDLRQLVADSAKPAIDGLLPDAPTVVISECCLCYLDPATATAVVDELVGGLLAQSALVGLVLYEPIRQFDRFGQQMRANLAGRGISFPTADVFPTLTAEKGRLAAAGLDGLTGAADVLHLWNNWISPDEQERIGRLEMVDELEEWELLASHYCVAWGLRSPPSSAFKAGWADLVDQAEPDGDLDIANMAS